MIRTLVVDHPSMVRAGLCCLLQNEAEITVVGQADSGEQALQLCRDLGPDLVLLEN